MLIDKHQQLIMMVGIPASGKSYIAELIKEQGKKENIDVVVHSSDKLREELFGDVNHQTDNNLLFQELHRRIKEDLNNKKTVVYDATNINKKRRRAFLNEIRNIPTDNKWKCTRTCLFVASTYEDCLEQNRHREKAVPEYVIKRMYKNFQPPSLDEGWDDILIIDNQLNEDSFKYYTIDDFFYGRINACAIDQENEHHKRTIGYHSLGVYEYLKKNCPDDVILQVAGLLHDIGKPFTKTNILPSGEIDSQYHYYNHQNVGAYDSFFYTLNLNLPPDDRFTIANLIYFHMFPFSWKTENAKEKYKKKFGDVMYNRLISLNEADIAES